MSLRYPGGIITKSPTAPTPSAAVGVWTLDQAMQYQKDGTWPPLIPTDSKYNYVTTLLLGSGTNQVANTTITDSSTNAFSVGRTGSPRQTSLTPYSQTDGSVYFDGSSYLTAGSGGTTITGDFTLEFWFNAPAFPSGYDYYFIDAANVSNSFAVEAYSSSLRWMYSGVVTGTATFTPVAGRWYHIALVRSGSGTNNCTMYVDGVMLWQVTKTGTLTTSPGPWVVGASGNGVYKYTGYISNFRFVNGTAVYTSNFQPPISSLTAVANTAMLTCQVSTATSNNAFYDLSSSHATVTATGNPVQVPVSPFGMLTGGGSQYLDGSSYLYVNDNDALDVGTGDFTLECWLYISSLASTFQSFVTKGGISSVDVPGYSLGMYNGNIYAVVKGGTTSSAIGSYAAAAGTYYHLALVRSSGSCKFFVNGAQNGSTTTNTDDLSTARNFIIGADYAGNNKATGFISNVRLIKGTAIYTGNFKPPFAALTTTNSASSYPSTTNVTTGITASNTSLLLNTADANFATATGSSLNNNTFLDSGPYAFPVTRTGTATEQGTFSPFAPTGESWSGYFNGVGYYLQGSTTLLPSTTTSTFTVEFWFYPTSFSTESVIIGDAQPTGSLNYLSVNIDTSGKPKLYWYTGASASCTGNTALTLNTWNYVAVRVSSNAISMYVNSSTASSLTGTTTFSNRNGSVSCAIGQFASSNVTYGYLSNIRVSNTARTISVPTSAFVSDSDTRFLTLQNNRFIDNGTVQQSWTATGASIQRFQPFLSSAAYSSSLIGGSIWLPGNNANYLSLPQSSVFAPAGDFTIECWVYQTTQNKVMGNYTGANSTDWIFYVDPTGYVSYYTNGNIPRITSAAGLVKANTWIHLALVRSNNVITGYANGNSIGTYAQSGTFGSATKTIYIGCDGAMNGFMTGYISNLKFINGTALYTSNFIPSNSPEAVTTIPNTAQTSVALNFTNAAMADSSMVDDWVTLGSVQSSTSIVNPFGASGYTLKLPGASTDYLTQTIPSSGASPSVFKSKEFTVECWIYMTTVGIRNSIYMQGSTGVGTYCGFECGINSSNKMSISLSTTGSSWAFADSGVGSTSLAANTWYHVAWVRSGSAITGYLNGVSQGTWAISSGTALYSTGTLNTIGTYYPPFGVFTGYISNLRITNGYARYTSNFSVPVTSFPTQGRLQDTPANIAAFTSSGTWTAPSGVTSVKALVVAGGGGGGIDRGGGGGAGGLIYNATLTVTPGTTYSVIVGAGGPANTGHGYPTPQNGSNSSFGGLIAYGGGVGGDVVNSSQKNGASGGSGGGGSHYNGAGTGGSATQVSMNGGTGYGNAGGSGYESGSGGGGGGAGGIGANAASGYGGNGGSGLDYSSAFGTGYGQSGYFAGGGGGGEYAGTAPGNGGNGGGGRGAYQGTQDSAQNGQVNTGGGGGGSAGSNQTTAGYGGSGVVIISW